MYQKWRGQSNHKSNSEQYNREDDSGSGFPIESSKRIGYTMNVGAAGHGLDVVDERSHLNFHTTLDSSGYREYKTQRSFKPRETAGQLSRFSNSVAARGSSQLDFSRDTSVHSNWPERLNARFEQQNDAESSHHLLGGPDSSVKINGQVAKKENTSVRHYMIFFSLYSFLL